jgi:hypothetical protein
MQLIERECAITLSVRGVGNYLRRWGFIPQKPIKKAYEQHQEALQEWLDKQYPEIETRTKAKLKATATERMQSLKKSSERVKSSFRLHA